MRNKFLIGTDMSRYQYGEWDPTYCQFVILKATEGRTYDDPTMNRFLIDMLNDRPQRMPFIGFYHYARAEHNNPEVEVENFLKKIEPHIDNCFMALDYEGDSLKLKGSDEWALRWCSSVKDRTGKIPLLYTSAAYVDNFKKTLQGFPLWVAHYNVKAPRLPADLRPMIWQFTSKPFDMNIFYGDYSDMADFIQNGTGWI